MGGEDKYIGIRVKPGQVGDISIDLVSPNSTGFYKGNWMLSDGSTKFGGGSKANLPFWVLIQVVPEPAAYTFDFPRSIIFDK